MGYPEGAMVPTPAGFACHRELRYDMQSVSATGMIAILDGGLRDIQVVDYTKARWNQSCVHPRSTYGIRRRMRVVAV